MAGYYDANGVWHDTFTGDETFVGYGEYGSDSTATFDNNTSLNQNLDGIVVGTASDIWADANNDIIIAGGDKLQTNHHSAVYGDYTVTVDTNPNNFDFSFHDTTGASSSFLAYLDANQGQFTLGDSVDNDSLGTLGTGNSTSLDSVLDSQYSAWLATLTGSGWSFSGTGSIEMVPANGQDTTNDTDTFWNTNDGINTQGWLATQEGSFGADHTTNNLILDFAVGSDFLSLTTNTSDPANNIITLQQFEDNFHVASVEESGNWAGLVNNSNSNDSTLTTPSTMIYTEDDHGNINWSVTLLGVHYGDLAGVDLSQPSDSTTNLAAVYTDLVGHTA